MPEFGVVAPAADDAERRQRVRLLGATRVAGRPRRHERRLAVRLRVAERTLEHLDLCQAAEDVRAIEQGASGTSATARRNAASGACADPRIRGDTGRDRSWIRPASSGVLRWSMRASAASR